MVRVAASPAKLRRKIAESAVQEAPAVVQQRLVEYFVVVSSQPRWTEHRSERSRSPSKRQTQTNEAGNIHLPQHQSQDYTFSPKITARYPLEDYPDNPLNPMIPQFCYPHSDSIVPSNTYVMPRVHHFVLTNDKGRKVYGTCLTIYEEYFPAAKDPYSRRHTVHAPEFSFHENDIEVTVDHKEGGVLYIPRVLCILSTWPYLLAFREYLTQLYRATTSSTMTAPLERYIQNLCVEIPAPPPGAFEIELNLFQQKSDIIKFWAPPAKLPVPYVALPYEILFECLDLENILVVWNALLVEQKVLLVSSQYSILTVCAEILQSLLFPLRWSHLYIPLLPRFLSPMLDAPIPYLVGVIRENWVFAEQNLSPETIVVDLDSNDVIFGRLSPNMVNPPDKKWTKLKVALEETVGDLFWKTRGLEQEYQLLRKGKLTQDQLQKIHEKKGNAGWKEKLRGFDNAFNMAYTPDSPNLQLTTKDDESEQQSQWERVQESFLRFFVSSLKSYRKFLHVPDDAAGSTTLESSTPEGSKRWNHQRRSFDHAGFIAWQKHENQDFYRELSITQQFDDFITKRLYSPGEPDVIFFDQNIDSKLNRSKLRMKKVETPFLLNAKAHKVLKTVRAVEPTNEGLEPNKVYRYESWPEKFDATLFGEPRPIPSMITAEFDRQAALVARLRATRDNEAEDGVDFMSGDFDPSPETAVFTVFFFTYGAVVGLDWQSYQERQQGMMAVEEPMEPQHLQEKFSEEGDKSNPRTVTTAGESEVSKEEEKKAEDEYDRLLLCEGAALSGMILNVPDRAMDACDLCPDDGSPNKEFFAMWSHEPPGSAAAAAQREASLLDMDDDHLAEYEEFKEIASAQLELAFDALMVMGTRGLPTDPDAFKSLMEACGRCGNTDKAIQLIQIMKRDGFVADSEIYSCFLNAFAQEESTGVKRAGEPTNVSKAARRSTDAYSAFLKKKLKQSKAANGKGGHGTPGGDNSFANDDSDLRSESSASDASVNLNSSLMLDIYNAVFTPQQQKRKKKKKRASTLVPNRTPLPDGLLMQFVLGESLLTYLYPKLEIDTHSDSCPHCSTNLKEDDIVAGWEPCEFQDFNTECPQCKHRFVPHFTVRCSSPGFMGTQGKGTPLYCEFLSPWVLRKELEFVIHGMDGVNGMLDPQWRNGTDIRATLWWNLIVAFNRFRLPVAFLLQGSFQNHLITPTPNNS
jgi:pentatricopeptide repeat protein